MVYVKKLVMKGFKSFARETEVPFTNAMNVIVGPNGSGKSNITDAICFVLGRMSAKSMRAEKASNLIFAGTKDNKPSHEASVKIVFDNTDKRFSSKEDEVVLERIIRKGVQGIYKINNEIKTRQEVIELLALAGIDPYGFNIVLQGEIAGIVKMNAEERRKVIEEVAGISIYETRKEKSIKEMEKTDEKLREVQAILKDRTAYLRNLEEERKQALRFKKLEEMIKRYKASILKKKIDEKVKFLLQILSSFETKEKNKNDLKEKNIKVLNKIAEFEKEIQEINLLIKQSTGIEQESLNNQISNLRASLSGLEVKREGAKRKLNEISARRMTVLSEIVRL